MSSFWNRHKEPESALAFDQELPAQRADAVSHTAQAQAARGHSCGLGPIILQGELVKRGVLDKPQGDLGCIGMMDDVAQSFFDDGDEAVCNFFVRRALQPVVKADRAEREAQCQGLDLGSQVNRLIVQIVDIGPDGVHGLRQCVSNHRQALAQVSVRGALSYQDRADLQYRP